MSIAIRKPRTPVSTYKTKPSKPTSKAAELLAVNNLDFPQEPDEQEEVDGDEESSSQTETNDLDHLISAIGRKCRINTSKTHDKSYRRV